MNRVEDDTHRDYVLLHVEDDDGIARLFQLALECARIQAQYFRVTDGQEALDFVLQRGVYTEVPSPDLIILDLYLPKLHGFEVLTEIRRWNSLNAVAVVVYSSSTDPGDRDKAIQLGANGFLIKAGNFSDFVEAARSAWALIPPGKSNVGRHH